MAARRRLYDTWTVTATVMIEVRFERSKDKWEVLDLFRPDVDLFQWVPKADVRAIVVESVDPDHIYRDTAPDSVKRADF